MIAKDALFARVAAGDTLTASEAMFLCQLCDGYAWLRALEAVGNRAIVCNASEAASTSAKEGGA